MNIRKYNFLETETMPLIRDSNYVWISFLGSGGLTKLRKVSAFNLYQTYFELNPPVDRIVKSKITGTKLYAAVQDGTYIAVYYSTSNPLSTYAYVSIPAGINEFPVDLAVDTDYFYLLTPGDATGENAKILKYTAASTPVLNKTIDLATINKARSIEIDPSDNLYVVTYESPAKFIKIIADDSYTAYEIKEEY
ncbi:unnamed protein product [marine sediment metagenome]|uniref:Uncharacterized protein n=1 Tax=marine sediment metagenome TaxID=412755 RepID=X1A6H1_9ZZZZ